jgi:hypothetical protein
MSRTYGQNGCTEQSFTVFKRRIAVMQIVPLIMDLMA